MFPTKFSKCTSGVYSCKGTCTSGFIRNIESGGCEDIDECLEGPCGASQVCENKAGSFSCDCAVGFKLLADACVSDTCDNFGDLCTAGEECVGVEGEEAHSFS